MPTKLQLFIFMMLTFGSLGYTQANSIIENPRDTDPKSEWKSNINLGLTILDDNVLYENENFRISKIYPNPASEFIAFDYKLNDDDTRAKIILRNVLGKEVAVFVLDSHAEKLRIPVREYVAGMYFYTLSINKQNIITRKFLVKH